MNFLDVMQGVAVHTNDDIPVIKAVDGMSEAVQMAAADVEEAGIQVSEMRGELAAAALNKSLVRHTLRDDIRADLVVSGTKMTETAIDDRAVSDSVYSAACLREVTAVKSLGHAEANLDKLTSIRDIFIATLRR